MFDRLIIKELFDNKNIDFPLEKTSVLVGDNGTGKSTILRIVYKILNSNNEEQNLEINHDDIKLFKEASLFTNEKEVASIKIERDIGKIIKEKSEEEFKQIIKNEKLNDEFIKIMNKVLGLNIPVTDISTIKRTEVEPVFISTIYMNANSVQKITTSAGRVYKFLDYEIQSIHKDLVASCDENLINKIEKTINNFFHESKKEIRLYPSIKVKFNNKEISFEGLSSGEKQLIYIFIKVAQASLKNSFILMDKPEISLHLSWQEKLLTEIRRINNTSQILVVTHSPAIVMNGWMNFTNIDDISYILP